LPYQYDAFLSYSSQDVKWAERIEAALDSRGIKVFRDKTRLVAGDAWDDQLQDAIEASRHLLLLWSNVASDSDWVMQERIYFESSRRNTPDKRRLIAVNLDDTNKALRRFEQITDISTAKIYSQGAASLDANPPVWPRVLNRLEEALKGEDSIPVYKLLMISTLERLRDIPLPDTANAAPEYGKTLEALGLKKDDTEGYKDELARYYDTSRSSWKPFGMSATVDQVLDELRDKLTRAGSPPFRWREPAPEFWSRNAIEVERAVNAIVEHLALLVIDPLSLYDPLVRDRLFTIRGILRPERCATAVLAPFPIPPATSHIREVLRGAALDLFRQYSNPAFGSGRPYPLMLCAHEPMDVHRILFASLDQQPLSGGLKLQTPFTEHGSPR
jgi:hypothetical protein